MRPSGAPGSRVPEFVVRVPDDFHGALTLHVRDGHLHTLETRNTTKLPARPGRPIEPPAVEVVERPAPMLRGTPVEPPRRVG